jgi:hypothetical protein
MVALPGQAARGVFALYTGKFQVSRPPGGPAGS